MANNCLVTKLKAQVDNDNLPYFGGFDAWVDNPTSQYQYVYKLVFNGENAPYNYIDNNGDTIPIDGNVFIVPKNSNNSEAHPWIFFNKYDLIGFGSSDM